MRFVLTPDYNFVCKVNITLEGKLTPIQKSEIMYLMEPDITEMYLRHEYFHINNGKAKVMEDFLNKRLQTKIRQGIIQTKPVYFGMDEGQLFE